MSVGDFYLSMVGGVENDLHVAPFIREGRGVSTTVYSWLLFGHTPKSFNTYVRTVDRIIL